MNFKETSREPRSRRTEMLSAVGSVLQADGSEMAGNACMSRYHFSRVFERNVGESPGALRRRLILERAAFELRTTDVRVLLIAFDAHYDSAEGFSRAFKRAFGLSPQAYRKAAQQIRHLPGMSGVHYDPEHSSIRTTLPGGKRNMDLIDRLLESDYTSKRRIVECARLLTDGQLDAPLAFRVRVLRFAEPPRTLRETLMHLFGESSECGIDGWVGAMYKAVGWQPTGLPARTVLGNSAAAMAESLEISSRAFHGFVQHVRAENLWDQEWVDDACEPPETFAVGRVIEESVSSSIALRRVLETMMEQMGFRLHEM